MLTTSEITKILDQIDEADDNYYNKNDSLISDLEYDNLKDQIKNLPSQKTKKLQERISNTLSRVGAPPPKDSKWKKVTHQIRMASLNKKNTPEEIKDWYNESSNPYTLITEKLDGLSLGLQYENGILILGYTRGDGYIGEDITRNVKKMKGVPSTLPIHFTGHIRGEMILKHSDLSKHFPELTNARNGASGIAKRENGIGSEHLTVMCYSIDGLDFKTEEELFQSLTTMGFEVPWYTSATTADDIIKIWNNYMDEKRSKLDYDIDGLVVRISNIENQLAFGWVNNRPRGAIAFKFKAFGQKTTIRKIHCQVGDTGIISPVAEFDEVEILGSKITKASLYNFSNIKNMNIDIGAEVVVERKNDVIPSVVQVITSTNTVFSIPTTCPVCATSTIRKGEYVQCPNKQCPAQVIGRINKWISELNIMEWGEKVLQKFIESNLVSDVADIYRLKAEDICNLDRMGEKSANNLIEELNKFREISIENFIGGLAIPGVATSTVKQVISAGYDSMEKILAMSKDQIANIAGFGDIRAEALYDGLRENSSRIKDILSAGVKIKARAHGVLTGKSFAFTGAASIPRPKMAQMVNGAGGEVKNSVVKGLTYLVIADPSSTSSKAMAAKKLGVVLISEQQLVDMIG